MTVAWRGKFRHAAGSARRLRGRGAASNPDCRYAAWTRTPVDDDGTDATPGRPQAADEASAAPATTLTPEHPRRIIHFNRSPDVGFDRSINPYRGCEHGCIYCFARPTHAWLDLSPGLDFETRLFWKPEAPSLLRAELSRPSYRCAPLALGINTDAYQPVERRLRLTRRILEVLVACHHPFSIVTKSALIERDLDLLAMAARRRQAMVMISLTTLDRDLARRLEPRAAAPQRRLEVIRRLCEAGVPVGVLVAPVIPVLTEDELERILEAARRAGARHAGYVLLRLPHELKDLFREWLQLHVPDQASHVLSRLRQMRGGKDYDARYGVRMTGEGPYAALLAQRFRLAVKRLGFQPPAALDHSAFRRPDDDGAGVQMTLFPDEAGNRDTG